MSSSSALPYLQKLRKSTLTDWAEHTDLRSYEDYTKPELAAALDEHLQSNRTIFGKDDRLAEYYQRLSRPSRLTSPVKKEAKVESTPSGDEAPKSSRRKSTRTKEEVPSYSVPEVSPRTPGQGLVSVRPPLPPSPAIVTDAIDRQTTAWRQSIYEAWTTSGVEEKSDSLRSALSSVKAVETIIFALEGCGLIRQILPLRFLTTVPAIEAIHSPEFAIKVPDLFVLLESSFWAPLLLWLLTSLLLPLAAAYFFNISLHVAGKTHAHNTRRRSAQASFDPLSFNIAKALIAYLVYKNHFTFWDVFSRFSVEKVNGSVPGEWTGMLTGSAIGTVGTLYEAILRK